MNIYYESYSNAIEQLGETHNTPAYAAAKENYFKVFEMCAAADIVGLVETDFIDPDYPEIKITPEVVDDLKRQVEILRQVNYRYTKRWEESLRFAQAQLLNTPA